MRRELTIVFVAISTLIVIAFVVPLGLSARSTARDRAMDTARAEVAQLVPLLATDDQGAITERVEAVNATGRLIVTTILPDGTTIGPPVAEAARLDQAVERNASLSGPVEAGREVVTAVTLTGGRVAAVRVLVSADELRRGVLAAWAVLGGLGLALVLLTVALADRIAQRVVGPASRLAAAARTLGDGRLDVRVEPDGPAELVATAGAFNLLAERVSRMLEDEREMVSQLTHRLRTPLTRLRIDLDRVEDVELRSRLSAGVDALTDEVNQVIAQARRKVDPPSGADLGTIAAERFAFWSALAEDEGRRCRFDGASALDRNLRVAIDADELGAAIDVLIENVFAHTQPGVAFELSVDADDAACRLTVDDGGPGLEAGLIGAGRSGSGSTGLGLSIVQRLADSVGGDLAIEPSHLGGARVVCRFPTVAGPIPDPIEPQPNS